MAGPPAPIGQIATSRPVAGASTSTVVQALPPADSLKFIKKLLDMLGPGRRFGPADPQVASNRVWFALGLASIEPLPARIVVHPHIHHSRYNKKRPGKDTIRPGP